MHHINVSICKLLSKLSQAPFMTYKLSKDRTVSSVSFVSNTSSFQFSTHNKLSPEYKAHWETTEEKWQTVTTIGKVAWFSQMSEFRDWTIHLQTIAALSEVTRPIGKSISNRRYRLCNKEKNKNIACRKGYWFFLCQSMWSSRPYQWRLAPPWTPTSFLFCPQDYYWIYIAFG